LYTRFVDIMCRYTNSINAAGTHWLSLHILTSILNNTMDDLPSVVVHNTKAQSWALLDTTRSDAIKVSKAITLQEQLMIDRIIRKNAPTNGLFKAGGIRLAIPQRSSKWKYTQHIGNFKCPHKGCAYEIELRRIDCAIGLYHCGNHDHTYVPMSTPGMPLALQEIAKQYVGQRNAYKQFMTHMKLLDNSLITDVLRGSDWKPSDFARNQGTKKAIANYFYRTNVKNRATVQKSLSEDKRVGKSEQDLIHFLQSRMKSVDEVVSAIEVSSTSLNNPTSLDIDEIVVLRHDVGADGNAGRWTHITFLWTGIFPLLKAAINARKKSKTGKMIEIDYTYLSKLLQLGCIGSSDSHKCFYAWIYDLNISESDVGASRMLCLLDEIIRKLGGEILSILKDKALALSAAAKRLSLFEMDCFQHMARRKRWTGPSGT